MLTVSQVAKTQAYRKDRLSGIPVVDAIERVRSASAFRAVAISAVEDASRKIARRKRKCLTP